MPVHAAGGKVYRHTLRVPDIDRVLCDLISCFCTIYFRDISGASVFWTLIYSVRPRRVGGGVLHEEIFLKTQVVYLQHRLKTGSKLPSYQAVPGTI